MLDKNKIKKAVNLFIEAIGEDKNREGLVETPERVARMADELFCPKENLTQLFSKTFTSAGSEMVLEKDIVFYSFCEHHLLPFFGVAHVAYIPVDKVLGLSKIARIVDYFCKKPQIQENLTAEIADAFWQHLKPEGVIVATQAEHLCLSMRGVKKPGAKTFTYAARGCFAENNTLKERFFTAIKLP
ncbi:MAG: GTP cyclohydrolase I FolE [Firmicutes bacterium]|nr:GTP cyclohydrolase I FolE [Bacillota bacterium]